MTYSCNHPLILIDLLSEVACHYTSESHAMSRFIYHDYVVWVVADIVGKSIGGAIHNLKISF